VAGVSDVPINFATQSNPGRFNADGTARLINAYSEILGEEGKVLAPIYCTDGLRPFVTLPKKPVRGMFAIPRQALFVIAGDGVFQVGAGGSYNLIGNVPPTGIPYWGRNRRAVPQVGLTVDREYFLIEAGACRAVLDPDLPPPGSMTEIDGYFVFSIDDESAGRFFIAGPDDGENIGALNFGVAQSNPDKAVRVLKRKSELLVMGEASIEPWTNTGATAQLPFEPVAGAAMDRGILAPDTAVIVNEQLMWAAEDETVRAASGYGSQIVSHHGVATSIRREPDKSGMRAFAYTSRNNIFYVLSGSTFTWVYNATNQRWHERQSHGEKRWRVSCAARWFDEWYAGDFETGELYTIDPDYHREGARPIIWRIVSPISHSGGSRVQYQRLQAMIMPGVGIGDDDGDISDPHAMLRYSDDNGNSWSNEVLGRVGKRGETRTRVMFRRLGSADNQGRVIDLSMSAAVARAFMGARGRIRRLSR
jgi:hypothetical protein